MNKTKYFLLKSRFESICVFSLVFHWIFFTFSALIFLSYKFFNTSFLKKSGTVDFRISVFLIIVALSAITLTVLYFILRKKNINLVVKFFVLDLLFRAIVLPYLLNSTLGFDIHILCMVPMIFIIVSECKNEKKIALFTSLLYAMCALNLIFIKIFLESSPVLPEKNFYLGFKILNTIFGGLELLYGTYTMNFKILRNSKKIQKRIDAIAYEADHDSLTGLMNRRRTYEVLNDLQDKKDIQGSDFAICIFDIDNFKKFNEEYGHDCGDFALHQFADRIRRGLNEDETKVGRWGGEEFIIIWMYYDTKIPFELDRLRRTIKSTPLVYNGKTLDVTATFGISSSRSIDNYEDVIVDADQKLLEGKSKGKDRVKVSPLF